MGLHDMSVFGSYCVHSIFLGKWKLSNEFLHSADVVLGGVWSFTFWLQREVVL